ncbi:MAG: STAS domain-containing protein [Candidatus Magnetominusculus sp. LBB02]|nr:STAS domain-containing protein [Candidatus Magnetominusculus sp. LBB02]
MEINIDDINGIVVISLKGRMDTSNASAADEKFKGVLAKSPEKVVVSLKGLDYVSSAGLRIFLTTAKEMKKTGSKLAFAEISDQVLKVLKMSGLDMILKIYKSTDDAINSLAP